MKYELPADMDPRIECRSCGQLRSLEQYRLFKTQPTAYMDFCVECEKRDGTIALYRRYHAYATKDIVHAVYAAERTPVERRTQEMVRLLVQPNTRRIVETNEQAIQVELERRELCRRSYIYYLTTFIPDYKPGWVHQDIARRLERFVQQVEQQRSPRLMIAMPPRHGKSAEASDGFPSWVLGKHPEWGIIGASHSITLPTDFSRNIRDRVRDNEHMAIFPELRLRTDSQGIEAWKTTKGGGYIAAGVGTGINGKGMHIGIADDLIKDAEAASSEVIRKAALAWYLSVFYTRLAPGGGILLIGTRWHDADVQGALLENEQMLRDAGVPDYELDNWEVVSYPAIAEEDEFLLSTGAIHTGTPPPEEPFPRLLRAQGEALHPERYPREALIKIKNTMPKSTWSALFQQNPTPDDGDFFKKDDLLYRFLPKDYWMIARRFICTDYAIKKNQRNDFTAIGVFALDGNDDVYLLEMRHARMGTYEIAAAIVALVEKYKPEVYAGEQGQIHSAVWPVVEKELKKRRLYVSVDERLVPITDKEARARPLQARTQLKKLFFSHQGERPREYERAEKELLRFPNGTHDDIVDMLSWGARLALTVSLPSVSQPKKSEGWRDRLNKQLHQSSNFMAA
jgi:predicted phage terminase large subunit-like protein